MGTNHNSKWASPRRHFPQFTLRELFFASTAICVGLGTGVNAVHRQQDAIKAILQAGGEVYFDYQLVPVLGKTDEFTIDTQLRPSAPAWMRSFFGEDYFRTAIAVHFYSGSINTTDLEQVRNCQVFGNL